MSDRENLRKLFNYYSFLLAQRETGSIKFNILPSEKNGIYDYFFRKVVKVLNYDGFPQVLSEDDFLSINVEPLCHGFTRFRYAENFLCDKVYFPGTGKESGFYSTKDFDEALSYTTEIDDEEYDNPDKVLEFKLVSNNGITDDELQIFFTAIYENSPEIVKEPYATKIRNLIDFLSTIKIPEIRKEFLDAITGYSIISAYLGFDYLQMEYNAVDSHYIILNRAAIAVDDESVKKFKKNAKIEREKEGLGKTSS